MMEALVKDGLLDKIRQTPTGGTLQISEAEALAICDAVAWGPTGADEVIRGLTDSGRCQFLGVTLVVERRRGRELTAPADPGTAQEQQ
jgi:hypothetical protein